ncbi:hypothetical protein Tco_0920725 [Tanacetum coccineum]
MQNYTQYDAQFITMQWNFKHGFPREIQLELISSSTTRTLHLLKQKTLMQTQEDHSNQTQALNSDSLKVDLVVKQNSCSEKEDSNSENASNKLVPTLQRYTTLNTWVKIKKSVAEEQRHLRHMKVRVNKRQMQMQESKIDTGKAVDADLISDPFIRRANCRRTDNIFAANNAELKAPQIPEKVFAIAALKNDLRKLKGNSVDTKFDKTSVLGKPVLPSLRNQSVVRQPNAFKSARAQMSKQRQDLTEIRFSPTKTSAVYEKTSSRSDLKVETPQPRTTVSTEVHQAAETVTTSNELDLLFGPLFDEYLNGENQVVLKSSAVTTADASDKRQQQPDSTSSTSTLATSVTADGNFDL